MKLINLFKQFAGLAAVAVMITSCDKVDVPEPLGDRGQTVIKVMNGAPTESPEAPLFGINFVATPQTTTVLDIRRDVPSNAALNTTQTVTVKVDTAMFRLYNEELIAAGDPPIPQMPTAWYTSNPSFTWGGSFDVTFEPGEFAKEVTITIPDATLMDPSSAYGFPFTITTTSPDNTISASRSIIQLIGAKNAYDGIYSVECGTVTRYTNPTTVENPSTLNGSLVGNPDVYMITVGANTVAIPPSGNPGAFYWKAGSNSQVAGIDGLRLTVDPSTNLTNMISLTNPTLTNWAGHVNRYDPATKTFYLAFRWNPTANVREYEVCLKYKGPR